MAENDKDIADSPEDDAMKSLEKKLPPYVVNCLKTAGFDSVDAICSMDVSERRENSIRVIENYVEQYYSTHQNLFANPSGCVQPKPFRFPPGHRMQIINFVREVKKFLNWDRNTNLEILLLFTKPRSKKRGTEAVFMSQMMVFNLMKRPLQMFLNRCVIVLVLGYKKRLILSCIH